MTKKLLLAILLLAAAAMVLSSCLVVARPHPHAAVVVGPPVEYGYQPLLYNGYVVYYDDAGIPYYWYGGSRIWIPLIERDRYVTHYHRHHSAYRTWYKHRGHHYRTQKYRHRGHKPTVSPKRSHQPNVTPHRKGKPTITPKARDEKPTITPKKKKKKKDKPTIRPR